VTTRLTGAIAVAAAFIAVHAALGVSPLWPISSWYWLAIAAVVVGGLPMPWWLRAIAWIGVAALTAWLVVPPGLFEDEAWEGRQLPCYAAVAGSVLVLGLLPARAPLVWVLSALIGGGVLFWAGIASFALLALALAAALKAVALVSRSAAVGAIAVAAVLHPALMAAGCFNHFSDVPTWLFAVVGLLPLLVLVRREPSVVRVAPTLRN
jgi:hypothetical protein